MRPIRAGKIHVPLAAIGGKKGNNRKKKPQPGWELQLPCVTALTLSARSICFSQWFLVGSGLISSGRLGRWEASSWGLKGWPPN